MATRLHTTRKLTHDEEGLKTHFVCQTVMSNSLLKLTFNAENERITRIIRWQMLIQKALSFPRNSF